MNHVKSIKMNSGRATKNFVLAISTHAALPSDVRFIACPGLIFLDLQS